MMCRQAILINQHLPNFSSAGFSKFYILLSIHRAVLQKWFVGVIIFIMAIFVSWWFLTCSINIIAAFIRIAFIISYNEREISWCMRRMSFSCNVDFGTFRWGSKTDTVYMFIGYISFRTFLFEIATIICGRFNFTKFKSLL